MQGDRFRWGTTDEETHSHGTMHADVTGRGGDIRWEFVCRERDKVHQSQWIPATHPHGDMTRRLHGVGVKPYALMRGTLAVGLLYDAAEHGQVLYDPRFIVDVGDRNQTRHGREPRTVEQIPQAVRVPNVTQAVDFQVHQRACRRRR